MVVIIWDWMPNEFFHDFSNSSDISHCYCFVNPSGFLFEMQLHERLGHIFSFFMKNKGMEMQESRGCAIYKNEFVGEGIEEN